MDAAHSRVNPVSGTFSGGPRGRGVEGVGAEARWVPFGGSVRTPPLLLGEMAVSGA